VSTHAAVTDRRSGRRPVRLRRRPTIAGAIASVLLVAGIVALALTLSDSARFEAHIAGWATENILGLPAQLAATGSQLTVGAGTATLFTIEVGVACSVVLLIVPLMLVAIAQLMTGRASVLRVLPAVVVGAVLLLAINALRIMLIVSMTYQQHLEGFGWAHTIYGSLVVLVGLAVTVVGFVLFTAGGFKRNARRDTR
jgi:exosortase/archaeosortase family protein